MKQYLPSFARAGLLAAVVFSQQASSLQPAAAKQPLRVLLNNELLHFDTPPEVIDGRTMVPVRAIVEKMGAQVTMLGGGTFRIDRGEKDIRLTFNSATAYVDDRPHQLPVPAYVKNERTYVPLRFVSESFSSAVQYEGATNTVRITTPPDGLKLTFPVLSDVHVQETDLRSQRKFRAALDDLAAAAPGADAMVINGDLTNGHPADYNRLRQVVREAGSVPQRLFYTIGNHEFYQAWFDGKGAFNPKGFPNGETNDSAVERFLALTGQDHVYYDAWVNGYHLIMLGSEGYLHGSPDTSDDAFLSEKQLQWLQRELREDKSPGKPVFVFLHQPLPHTVSGSMMNGAQRSVVQHERLRAILSDHSEVILFTGHTHRTLRDPRMMVRETFTMVNSSAVIQPESGGDAVLRPEESEALFVEVYEDKVLIRARDLYRKRWMPDLLKSVSVPRSH